MSKTAGTPYIKAGLTPSISVLLLFSSFDSVVALFPVSNPNSGSSGVVEDFRSGVRAAVKSAVDLSGLGVVITMGDNSGLSPELSSSVSESAKHM